MDITPITKKQLSQDEKSRLEELENIIDDTVVACFRGAYALREIRDKELFCENYDTFEDYYQDRWDLKKRQIYHLISAIETIEHLKSKLPADTTILPTCERQVRPLTKLPPKKQVEVWEQVICEVGGGEKLTSGLVSRMIRETLEETGKKNKRAMAERIDKEDRYSREFRMEFNGFLKVLNTERDKGWKETSREAVIIHLEELLRIVKEMDI